MEKISPLKLFLLLASAIVAFGFPVISGEKVNQNKDVRGQLTMHTDGEWTCTVGGDGKECMVSDCKAPGISTGCFDEEDDDKTTINDKMEGY